MYRREVGHSRRIRRLKVVLPTIAGLFFLAMIGRSVMLSYLQSGQVSISSAMIEDGRLVMENPRTGGYTADRRPYEMSAARAIQSITDSSFVDLEEIVAQLPVGAADWASVEAATGTMTKADNMLRITSPALVKTTDGLVARLKSAKLDMGRGDLTSNEPVEISNRDMRVTADSMTIVEGGDLMVFENRVKVTIDGRKGDTTPADGQHASK